MKFKEGCFVVITDIEKMFNQVIVSLKDVDAVSFLRGANSEDDVNNYPMLIHIFGRIDSRYFANWILQNIILQNMK